MSYKWWFKEPCLRFSYHGYSNSWMVIIQIMENPKRKWWRTGGKPHDFGNHPLFWCLEVRSHFGFHEVATLPPKDLVWRAVVGRRIASRLRGMGKPWETVGNLGKDRKSRMWNSASEELRSECAWLSWCHPQNCKKSRCYSFKWTKNVAKCVFREFLQLLQQNYLSFPALVPVGLASQCWIPELLKGRHWRIQPGTAQRCVQNLLVVFKAAGDLLDLDFH